jgi:hypothetical protein
MLNTERIFNQWTVGPRLWCCPVKQCAHETFVELSIVDPYIFVEGNNFGTQLIIAPQFIKNNMTNSAFVEWSMRTPEILFKGCLGCLEAGVNQAQEDVSHCQCSCHECRPSALRKVRFGKSWEIRLSPGCHPGINFCQIHDWFWYIWTCWTQLRNPK